MFLLSICISSLCLLSLVLLSVWFLNCREFFKYSGYNPFVRCTYFKYFLSVCEICIFVFSVWSFDEQRFSVLKSSLSIFPFVVVFLWVLSKKSLLSPSSWRYSYAMYYAGNFIVLAFVSRPRLAQTNFNVWCEVKDMGFFFFSVLFPSFCSPFAEKMFLSLKVPLPWYLCKNQLTEYG